MGGHSAWRKRVAAGEPAKGRGGAIARHRPHLGRKGGDLKLNRKGNIAGGNPKKSRSNNNKGILEEQEGNDAVRWKGKGASDSDLKGIFLSSFLTVLAVSLMAVTYWLLFR